DLEDRLRGALGGVLVAADAVEVVEPDQQRREQREHQRLDHHQPEPAAVLAGRAGHVGTRWGSTFASSPSVSGMTTRASAMSQERATTSTRSSSPTPTAGSRSSR